MKITLDSRSSADAVFEALADRHRRHVLCLLARSEEETMSLTEVSEHIGATLDSSVEAVETNLYHKDLPKLERAGFVEYDERSGVIRSRNCELISKLQQLGFLDCTT